MKKWLPALVLLCGLAIVTWYYHETPESYAPPQFQPVPPRASQAAAISNALARQNSNTVAVIESNFAQVRAGQGTAPTADASVRRSGPPSPLQFTNLPPETVLENMRRAINEYGTLFGGNPVGNNAEITAALKGGNPRQINLIDGKPGLRLNDQGELIDPWGTPYFFHQLSGNDTEIRSAGPDKTMWTDDDLVVP